MTEASAQHTAKAEFNRTCEIQNHVSVDHGLPVTKITELKYIQSNSKIFALCLIQNN